MSEKSAFERGSEMISKVYAGNVSAVPEGAMPFYDVMMKSLFAEVWDRDVLSMRDRRLLIMGAIAAHGAKDVWKIQAASALANGELTPDELRETLIMLAPYGGYPNVAPFLGDTEAAIAEWEAAQNDENPSPE